MMHSSIALEIPQTGSGSYRMDGAAAVEFRQRNAKALSGTHTCMLV